MIIPIRIRQFRLGVTLSIGLALLSTALSCGWEGRSTGPASVGGLAIAPPRGNGRNEAALTEALSVSLGFGEPDPSTSACTASVGITNRGTSDIFINETSLPWTQFNNSVSVTTDQRVLFFTYPWWHSSAGEWIILRPGESIFGEFPLSDWFEIRPGASQRPMVPAPGATSGATTTVAIGVVLFVATDVDGSPGDLALIGVPCGEHRIFIR